MTWVKLNDGLWRDPDMAELSDAAGWLWTRSLTYCADQETDGRLPPIALRQLRARPKAIRELVDAGRWGRDDDGYFVRKFLDYNPSREENEARRRATKQRVERMRKSRGAVNDSADLAAKKRRYSSVTNTDRNAGCNAGCNAAPDPDPDHLLIVDDGRARERAAAPAADPPLVQPPSMTRCPPGTSLPDAARDDLAAGLGVDRATIDRAHDEAVTYYVLGGGAASTRERGRWALAIRQAIVRSVKGGFASRERAPGRMAPHVQNDPEDIEYLRRSGFLS